MTRNRCQAVTAAVLLSLGCGGDTSTTSTVPALVPPPPAPPPLPPAAPGGLHVSASGEDFVEWAWNAVEDATGYDVQFSRTEAFTGEDEIIARAAEELSYRREGLAPGTSAHLRVRAASGSGEDRITSDWSSQVTGMTLEPPPPDPVRPEPTAECAAVLEAVEGSPANLLNEWWHTPFSVNFYDNFPVDVVGPDYLPGQFSVVQGLADQIEAQLGHPIIGSVNLVTPPEGWTPEHALTEVCQDWREPGEITVFHLPEGPGEYGGPVGAELYCANVDYWVGDGVFGDPLADSGVIRLLFAVLGFAPVPGFPGVPMSPSLNVPYEVGLTEYTATEEDIAALGCLYPKPPE